jgi:signal transduction histidine kinase
MDQFARRDRLMRYACIAMIAAAGLWATYSGLFDQSHITATPYWAIKWTVAYAVFVVAYALMPSGGSGTMTARQGWSVALQALSAFALVWLYHSFIVACLLVVVAWQLALLLDFRYAIAATAAQLIALAMIRCAEDTSAMAILVVVTCGGFQLFAVCAAQLLRSERAARDELARANTELTATQALLDESARMAERLRIARDLHDVMGHTLTTLTIHLDVASKLTSGAAAEHVAHARTASAELLDQVRTVVSRFRSAQPINLHSALEKLAESARGLLDVRLQIPPDLAVSDPARAETVIRCVQEVITNAMRHAHARQLVIEVRQPGSGISIIAHDDGQGGEFAAGSGLAGMRERFEMLGGRLSIRSAAGEGFTVEGILPLAAESMP